MNEKNQLIKNLKIEKTIDVEEKIDNYIKIIIKFVENTCKTIDIKFDIINQKILRLDYTIKKTEKSIAKYWNFNKKINKNFEILSKNLKYSIYRELKKVFKTQEQTKSQKSQK